MKKVYCNNLLAKVLLAFSSCHTITIGPFVLSKRPEEKITQKVRNHECTHARQWVEMAVAIGTVIWILLLCFDLSAWWLVLAGLVADGVTEVHDVEHIDRGYPHFVEDMTALGGRIQRVDSADES